MNINELELTEQDIAWHEADSRAAGDGFLVTQCTRARSGDRSAINAIKYVVYGIARSRPEGFKDGGYQEHAHQWRAKHRGETRS